MIKRLTGLTIATMLLSGATLAKDVTISVNTNDGQTIKGEHKFVVRATSTSLVTSVEFYVGDSLRDTDESTPYEFTVDTLNEKEGDFVVRLDAFTENGQKASKTLKLKIDNGISKGVQFHVDAGREALAASKWDDALLSGRIALKIDAKNNDARMVMARANFGKRIMDLSQKYLEDVIASDPKNSQALELLAAINLDRAFSSMSNGSNRAEVITSIGNALKQAASSRRSSLGEKVTTAGTPTDANLWQWVSTMVEAGRYSLVIEKLAPMVVKDSKNTVAQNWLIYTQIRAGRFQAATNALKAYERFGAVNGYGYALKAILFQYGGDEQTSRAAEKDAILDDPNDVGVKSAQVYLALRRNENRAFAQLANDLAKNEGQSYVTNYYLGTLNYRNSQFTEGVDYLKKALLAEPASYDIYVERANEIITYIYTDTTLGAEEKAHQFNLAKAFLEAALIAKPESFQALTGLSLVYALTGKAEEAIKFGKAAAAAGPEYAPAHYALTAANLIGQKNVDARESMRNAEKMDKILEGRSMPSPYFAWQYFNQNGRLPLLTPPPVK